ncbi:acyl carrier protein [uncultured Mycobacterium sp.]|uniref:acyl carrier protein n=1 Tax=uncultured Mycobacterium sp. TaxID=171292 RepID=UPI0035C982A7
MTPDNAPQTSCMDEARRLLAAAMDAPDLAWQIDETKDFLDAGVNSGEIIRLLFECEKHLGVEIDDAEMSSITSLKELAALLHRYKTGSGHVV